MNKILEGNLAHFAAPDLLTFLNMGRLSAVLVLERPDQETKLFLRDGQPVFASSTKDALRLGSLLVKLGKAQKSQVDSALQKARASGFRVGQALLSSGLVGEPDLQRLLKVQVSEVIFDIFEWREGVFSVFDRVEPPAAAVTLEMDLQNLIMEGVRRLDERGRIKEVFPELDASVEAVTNLERIKHSVSLTPEEWQIFFLVDGRRTLREICRLSGEADELSTLVVLSRLLAAKFIAIGVPSAPTTPNTSSGPVLGDSEPEGTQWTPLEKATAAASAAPPAPEPVAVEFNSGIRPKPIEDDTHEIVNPKAVAYMAQARHLTISRLILLKDGAESSYPLTKDAYTLGRHRNNDIVIGDPKVSAFHARIDRTEDGFVLVDLHSRNGCFVNGKRAINARLQTGDEIRLGTARLVYKIDYTSAV